MSRIKTGMMRWLSGVFGFDFFGTFSLFYLELRRGFRSYYVANVPPGFFVFGFSEFSGKISSVKS